MKKTTQYRRDIQTSDVSLGENNEISFSCASQLPYVREDEKGRAYEEILLINDDSIDFTRLVDNRAPILLQHNDADQIGVVQKAWIENEKLYITAKFSSSPHAQEILQDMRDGIRRNISIGYYITDYRMEEGVGQLPKQYVTRFTIYEVSVVSARR